MRKLTCTLLVLAAVAAAPRAEAAHLKVAATLGDLAAITHAIGGEHVTVDCLAPPTVDPHYVDPRPSLILLLSKADLLVVNGLDLEAAWLHPLINNSRNADLQIGSNGYLDVSAFVERLQIPTMRIDRSMGDIHPGGNPHFTFDPRRAKPIAAGIAARLALLDPEHAAAFQENLAAFTKQLDHLITVEHERFAKLPAEQRKVVVYHQSLIYVWDWLGIEQVATVEPKPGIPPTPGDVAKVLRLMKATGTHVLVQEDFYQRGPSQTLAQLTKGTLVVVPGTTRYPDGQDYLQHIHEVTDALYAALAK
ncbi:MAG: zinc ABC transporter substrate-binding protein [Deltaproteobacteria bacterium]|nr:zinc ABC transporter substrate-binding protein [Deltaproteobacteria bacterium]